MQDKIISRLSALGLLTRKPALIDVSPLKLLNLKALISIFFIGLVPGARAQQQVVASAVSSTLLETSNSPGALQAQISGAIQPQSSTSISGAVRDSRGALLAGVQVTLEGQGNTVNRVVAADDNGAFTFADLSAGTYRVKINVTGLEPFTSTPVVVGAGEKRELPVIAMRIATKTTTVGVVATLNEVAEAQVKEEEQQRIFGFLPNYYTSYIWTAAPMTRKLKFTLALRTATDPVTFLVVAGVAGVEQSHKTFPGYGQGFEGYAKRYGASYADTVSGRMFGSAIFPVLFHQDPRYFYRGSGSARSRLLYALMSTAICRGDNGQLEPNYSHVLGSFAAAGLSNVYRAPQDRQASLTFRNGLIIVGSGAVVNVLREFLSKKLTANVPGFANGKP